MANHISFHSLDKQLPNIVASPSPPEVSHVNHKFEEKTQTYLCNDCLCTEFILSKCFVCILHCLDWPERGKHSFNENFDNVDETEIKIVNTIPAVHD